MHLQFDHAAGFEANRGAGRQDLRIRARCVCRQQSARRLILPLRPRARLRPRRQGHLVAIGSENGRALHIGLGLVERQRVVHDFAVAGPELDRLNPLRFREVCRDVEVLVFDHPVGRHGVLLLHFKDDVRRAHGPTVRVDRRGRHVLRVALGCACGHPAEEHFLFLGSQPALVQERAFRRDGMPRRHVSFADFVANVLGMRPDVVVGQERHRCDLAGPMAGRAVLEENRGDVFGVGRTGRRCLFSRKPKATERQSSDTRQEPASRLH